jgi:hypothetical protein
VSPDYGVNKSSSVALFSCFELRRFIRTAPGISLTIAVDSFKIAIGEQKAKTGEAPLSPQRRYFRASEPFCVAIETRSGFGRPHSRAFCGSRSPAFPDGFRGRGRN